MEIKKILKPKSADDINTSICQLYDISVDNKKDIETINKLYNIIDIRNCDTSVVKIYYLAMVYSSDNEQQKTAAAPLSDLFNAAISLSRIEIRLQSYDFKIKKKINSWSKIYREFVNMILNEGVIINKEINDKRNLFLHINMCSNMIAQSSRKGPATFIITSNKIKKIIDEDFRHNYIIIIDDKLKDSILIGRKDNLELDSNIRLLKHKNFYKISTCEPSEIKNYYICLNCELKF